MALINSGKTISEVSRLLNLSRPTIYRWKLQLETTGSTTPRSKNPPPYPSKIKDWQKFKEFVDQNGDRTTEEMARLWGGCSRHAISRGLKKLGYTRKKKR
ncbi:helix-turn-helix domain-containing protein [Limnospira platensis CENA597]|uniref:helix-turn-helix domain-containing protein n=1 Tax=Limnospira platensis TaxID=118562 RepID=UPI003DA0B728